MTHAVDKMLVNATGALEKQYSNRKFKEEVQKLVENSTAHLTPGTRPFGMLDPKQDCIQKSDPPHLYAKKLLKFLSDQELRLALQIFVILNNPQSSINDTGSGIAHARPSTIHAEKCILLVSAEVTDFETEVALDIIRNNEPFLDSQGIVPFGQSEDDEGLQHSLESCVERLRSLK